MTTLKIAASFLCGAIFMLSVISSPSFYGIFFSSMIMSLLLMTGD